MRGTEKKDKMPSMTLKKDNAPKISISERSTIHVNKNFIAVEMENQFATYHSSRITLLYKNKDNISVHLGQHEVHTIRTGGYTEEVYSFIIKNLYELDLDDKDLLSM